tara:strand:- start:2906 stop:3352 length:447 start_codon:yes stop_codon:yes gene_type:complete
MKINVKINEKSWKYYLRKPENIIKKKVTLLNKNIKFLSKNKFIVTLVLSNTKEIKKLNSKFRGKNKSTDILSFPFNDKPLTKIFTRNKKIYLGDIIINIKKVKKEYFINNFDKLWIHGLLHLLGYTHKKDKEYKKMLKLERIYYNIVS